MYLQINNLFTNGDNSYKGLDISKFRNPVYSLDSKTCVTIYNGELIEHNDVVVITESEYNSFIETVNNNRPLTQEERTDQLEKENERLKKSQVEQDELIMGLMLGGI